MAAANAAGCPPTRRPTRTGSLPGSPPRVTPRSPRPRSHPRHRRPKCRGTRVWRCRRVSNIRHGRSLCSPPLLRPRRRLRPSRGTRGFPPSPVSGGDDMTIHRGRGFASINYPIGMNLGGDPSQALVHSNPGGKFMVALSSIDLGQGMKSVTRQIAAETLGVPVEDVYVDTADSDTGPHCMGSFASRGTHRVGNAVIAAAREARAVMLEAAAEELEVDPGVLVTDGKGNINVRGGPSRFIPSAEACAGGKFRQGRTVSGRGIFLIPLSEVEPETGEQTPGSCLAHAAMVVEVEVDDETGEVTILEMNSAYELGRA